MSREYVVTGDGVMIWAPLARHGAATLRNVGSDVVWVDDDQNAGTTQGLPLGPDSQLVWDADRPLWATCAGSSRLVVSDNASAAMFDPQAVAVQVAAIGTPSPNRSLPIVASGDYPAAWPETAARVLDRVDVSAFASLTASLAVVEASTSSTPPRRYRVVVEWHELGAAGRRLAREEFVVLGTNDSAIGSPFGAGHHLSLAVRGPVVSLTVQGVAQGPASGQDVLAQVWGGYAAVERSQLVGGAGGYWGASGQAAVQGDGWDGVAGFLLPDLTGGAQFLEFPPIRSGPATLTLTAGQAVSAPGLDLFLADVETGLVLGGWRGIAPAGPMVEVQAVTVPPRAVAVSVRNRSGSPVALNNTGFALTYR